MLKDVDMYDDKNAVQEIEEPKNRNIQVSDVDLTSIVF